MTAGDYIAKQPEERRKLLTGIHEAILQYDKTVISSVTLMMGKEMINYFAPGTFKYALSSVKNYISLHVLPMYGSPVIHEKYQKLLPLASFQKGCINFTDEKQLPLVIVKDLIRECSVIDLVAIRNEYLKSKGKKAVDKKEKKSTDEKEKKSTGKKDKNTALSKIALFDKLVATNPKVERKGATNPYTSFNGNMFMHMTPEGVLAIRLPAKEREVFIKKYRTTLQESYGIIRKEYVVVPDSLLSKTDELKPYFDISYAYAKTLKPKPTTKSKK